VDVSVRTRSLTTVLRVKKNYYYCEEEEEDKEDIIRGSSSNEKDLDEKKTNLYF